MIAWTRRWSISTRLFALQFVFILLLTSVALIWLWNDARGIVESNAADRSLSVATSIADNPFVVDAVESADQGTDPSVVLQPYAVELMADTRTDFITIMAPDRTRYTHPNPAEIGKPFVGNIEPALEGRAFTETYTGTLGPSVRSVVPIVDANGTVIALVAAGITVSKVSVALTQRLPFVFGFAALTLLFGALASWLLSRYLRRVTWGRGPEEMSRMFLYYEGVLHSVREGLVLVDPRGRLVLHNDQAADLLGIGPSQGEPVAVSSLQVPDALRSLLASGDRAVDEIFVTENRVLVVNQEPAVSASSRVMGTVTTLRDHTDLLRISGELQNMRTLSDALRSQTHEYANRLHTIVALIELGRPDDAISLAAGELDRGQSLADQLVEAADEPVLAALLVGKSAQARERGVSLELEIEPGLGMLGVPPDDLITIVGNLVDNALDAAAEGAAAGVSAGASAGSSAGDEGAVAATGLLSASGMLPPASAGEPPASAAPPAASAEPPQAGAAPLAVSAPPPPAGAVLPAASAAPETASAALPAVWAAPKSESAAPPRVVVSVSAGAPDALGASSPADARGEGILIIRVVDNGPGIVDVERAFERGYSSKTAGPHGRGFGLALVGQSVRRLGGRIDVASSGGAVVTVTLPRAGAPATDDPTTLGPTTHDFANLDPANLDPTTHDSATLDPATFDPAGDDPAALDPAGGPATLDPTAIGPAAHDRFAFERSAEAPAS